MTTCRLDSNGSIFLDDDLLDHLRAGAGSRLEIELADDRTLILSLANSGRTTGGTFETTKRQGQKQGTIEGVSDIAEKGWAGEK